MPIRYVVRKNNRTIAVTTSATATAYPETAIVRIGFIVYGVNRKAAYASGSKTSNAIAAALKAAAVPKKAIQSESQDIGPVQQWSSHKWTRAEKAKRKFQVTQRWSVKTEAANGAKILDVAVKAGANESGKMSWSSADPDAVQAKAAKLALDRALRIAKQMAGSLNASLGPLVYATNESPSGGVRNWKRSGSDASMSRLITQEVAPLSISPPEVTASATVYAVFSIR